MAAGVAHTLQRRKQLGQAGFHAAALAEVAVHRIHQRLAIFLDQALQRFQPGAAHFECGGPLGLGLDCEPVEGLKQRLLLRQRHFADICTIANLADA